ncbi:MAG: hypothetical protein QE487_18065 [Fluviicola sp.]|nr:hypothetical protein [Fluviicola sp.]
MHRLIFIFVLCLFLPKFHFAQQNVSAKQYWELYADSLAQQKARIDSLKQELSNAEQSQLKNSRIIDSLRKEQEWLRAILDNYNAQIRNIAIENQNQQRLTHIRKLYSQYHAIQLPFHYQTSDTVSYIPAEEPLDTLIFGEYIPVYVIGILPDTSNYYCFFYLIPADDALPAVATFNKKGELISRKLLIESCWKGAESDCESILRISPTLEINFSYREYQYDADDEGYYSNTPYEAAGYIETSKIASNGEWILIERIEQSQEELFKNPIIHDIWRD